MMSPAQYCSAAGAELDDRPASPDYVLAALLDAGEPGQQVLVAGVAVGHQQPGERGRDAPRRRRPCAARRGPAARSAARPGSGRSARAAPRRGRLLLLFRVRLVLFFPRRRAAGRSCPARSPGSRPRPALPPRPAPRSSPRRTRPSPAAPPAGRWPCPPSPARHGTPEQHAMTCAARSGGTFP